MSGVVPSSAASCLTPVKDGLLAAAQADAEAIRTTAHEQAMATQAAAREDAAELLRLAREQGAAEARLVVDDLLVRRRRAARALVLESQRMLYEMLRARIRDAALQLRDRPDYPVLLSRLADRARDVLGPEARIRESAEAGGIVAEAGSHQLDLRLSTLADRALSDLGVEARRLWTT